jgi:hypothetical protein
MSEESRLQRAIKLYGTSDPKEIVKKDAELLRKHQKSMEELHQKQRELGLRK